MSNDTQAIATIEADIRAKWGQFGVSIRKKEMEFQARAQQIKAKLKTPTKIQEVTAAEEALKLVRAERKQLEADRIEITNKFKAPIARLSAPEDSFNSDIKAAEEAIIKIKRADAEEKRNNKAKTDEAKEIRESVIKYMAEKQAAFLLAQSDLIQTAYNFALDNIPPAELDSYLEKVKKRVTVEKYTMQPPTYTALHHTSEEIDAIIADAFQPISGEEFVISFENDLANRFDDYSLAWKNKEQARDIATAETEKNTAAINQQRLGTIATARLQTLATPADVAEPLTKPLKSVWKLDMEETWANAMIIMEVFRLNMDAALPEVEGRIKKPFNLSVKQMGAALEGLRNSDAQFTTTGLQWKEEDKL